MPSIVNGLKTNKYTQPATVHSLSSAVVSPESRTGKLLELMTNGESWTTAQLAKRLGCTKNQAGRTIRNLRSIGFSIDCRFDGQEHRYEAA